MSNPRCSALTPISLLTVALCLLPIYDLNEFDFERFEMVVGVVIVEIDYRPTSAESGIWKEAGGGKIPPPAK